MMPNSKLTGIVKVQRNGEYGVKVTIPKDVAREQGIAPGDHLLVSVDEQGHIILSKDGVLA